MKLFVGQTRFSGPLRRYAQRFGMVELRAEPGRLPRAAKLRGWRAEVGEGFVFALTLGLGAYEPKESEAALDYASRVGAALEASWWVLRSPSFITPAPSMVRRLGDLVSRLPGGARVAWEPSGPWDEERSLAVAKELGIHLVRDGSRDVLTDDTIVYTRLRGLGEGANVSLSAAEQLVDQLHGRQEAYVVVEGAGAGRVRAVLASELQAETGAGDEEDDAAPGDSE